MFTIKATLGSEIRRLTMNDVPTYEKLEAAIREIFRMGSKKFDIKYLDDEGDLVTLSSQSEFDTAMVILPKNSILRLTIEESKPRKDERRRFRGFPHHGGDFFGCPEMLPFLHSVDQEVVNKVLAILRAIADKPSEPVSAQQIEDLTKLASQQLEQLAPMLSSWFPELADPEKRQNLIGKHLFIV